MSRLAGLSMAGLGRKSLAALSARILGAAAGFVFQVALARLLGAHEAGIYALALTLSLVASTLGRVGMDSAVLKHGASAFSRHDMPTLAVVERSLHMLVLPISVALAVLGILLSPWLAVAAFDNPAMARTLQWMFASVPMLALSTLYAELLRAADRHVTAALLQGGAMPMINLALLALLAPLVTDAARMAMLYVVATVLLLVLGRLAWRRAARRAGAPGPAQDVDPAHAAEPLRPATLFGTGLRMFPAAVGGILMAWVDVLLLGVWAPSDQVGIYNAAVRTALLTSFMLLAINSVVAPRFASAALRDDPDETARLARRACLLSLASTLPILVVFVLFAEPVLSIFGPAFVAGATALVIVSAGQAVNALTGPVGHLLNMRGFHVDESRLSMAAVVLNVALCGWLIPRHGIVGAAASNAAAVTACNLGRVLVVRARLGFWVYPGV